MISNGNSNSAILTGTGVILPESKAFVSGVYWCSVNDKEDSYEENLLPDEGILHLLNVVYGATAKLTNWYLALYAGAIDPANTWTAANFAANSSEITSLTEGYSSATRPLWVPGVAASGNIDNYGSRASFTVVTASSIIVNGAGLLSDSTRGGTAGVLASATRFAAQRTLYDTDVFQVGYRVRITSV